MKIAIGSDHGGFELKELLSEILRDSGNEIDDVGCYSMESVDYPDFANTVCQRVGKQVAEVGILICGTGIGMSLAANRFENIRAALCHDEYTARLSREHNDANILCLGARVLGSGLAEEIVKVWLSAEFLGGRHKRRINLFSN